MAASPFEVGSQIVVTPFLHETPLVVEILSAESFDQGGSAKIFEGLAKVPYQPYKVALKVISHVLSDHCSELVRRELQTVTTLARRSMRRILPFIGTATVGFYSVIVMEYMRNGNMVQYFRGNPTIDRQRLLIQVAEAVYWLHDFINLVHGDLKCENVLINEDGDAVLADFGLSTLIEQEASSVTTCTDIRNLNTFRFAAPELLGLGDAPESATSQRSKTPQGDVYAFGMLVLQAFTGKHPWPHLGQPQNVFIALMKHTTHPRPSDDATGYGLTDSLWAVCLECWNYEPSMRPTMHEVWDMLRNFKGYRKGAVVEAHLVMTFNRFPDISSWCERPGSLGFSVSRDIQTRMAASHYSSTASAGSTPMGVHPLLGADGSFAPNPDAVLNPVKHHAGYTDPQMNHHSVQLPRLASRPTIEPYLRDVRPPERRSFPSYNGPEPNRREGSVTRATRGGASEAASLMQLAADVQYTWPEPQVGISYPFAQESKENLQRRGPGTIATAPAQQAATPLDPPTLSMAYPIIGATDYQSAQQSDVSEEKDETSPLVSESIEDLLQLIETQDIDALLRRSPSHQHGRTAYHEPYTSLPPR